MLRDAPAGIFPSTYCTITLLCPLNTQPTALPSKLYVVQTLDGILCISLIIHVHKCKTCSKMEAFATEL
jgi:hypothetical protein